MLFTGAKKEALAIHERAVNKYNALLADFQRECELLYAVRKSSVAKIENIESLINSIANTPKEFEKNLSVVKSERTKFRQTEEYAAEAYQAAIRSGVRITSGVAGGAAVAIMVPTATKWVAKTFGTASTGTAISTLSGNEAIKVVSAWLRGGASGGGGVAAGQAFLALAGAIGWGISAGTTIISVVALGKENKKISEEAIMEAKQIAMAGAQLHKTEAVVAQIHKETELVLANINEQYLHAKNLQDADYSALDSNAQLFLGSLVNTTLCLAEMLHKTVN